MKKTRKKISKFITRTSSKELLGQFDFKRCFDPVRRLCDLLGPSGIRAKKGQTDVVMWRNRCFTARWATRRQALAFIARMATIFGDAFLTVLTRVKSRKKSTAKLALSRKRGRCEFAFATAGHM